MYNDASHDDIGVLGRLCEESEKFESFCMYNAHGNAPGTLYYISGKPCNLGICSVFTVLRWPWICNNLIL